MPKPPKKKLDDEVRESATENAGDQDMVEENAAEDSLESADEPVTEPPKRGKSSPKKVGSAQKSTAEPADRPKTDAPGSQRKRMFIIAAVIVLLGGSVTAGYFFVGRNTGSESNRNGSTNADVTGEERVPRRIDGVLDDPEDQNHYLVAIMVENHTASRPQSGLDKANIVFEALAEGGITRFLALYTLTDPIQEIGPVRSARPYYIDWARGYNAMYVHIGGSPKALARLNSTNAFDLNQFFNSQYFYRDKTRDVASEHTLYTSAKLMQLALLDKQAPTPGDYQPWKYKSDADGSSRPASQHITINFSTFSYKVDYEYDPVKNDYARLQAEQPHVMRDGTTIRPKNVVVLTVKRRLEEPVDGKGRLEMDTIGEGPARYFLDGKELIGTWSKRSPQDPLDLRLEDGSDVQLNAGQTWVEIVPPDQEVTVR